MNKFRNNLHSAFYEFNENGSAYRETILDKDLEIAEVEKDTKANLDALEEEIRNPDF